MAPILDGLSNYSVKSLGKGGCDPPSHRLLCPHPDASPRRTGRHPDATPPPSTADAPSSPTRRPGPPSTTVATTVPEPPERRPSAPAPPAHRRAHAALLAGRPCPAGPGSTQEG